MYNIYIWSYYIYMHMYIYAIYTHISYIYVIHNILYIDKELAAGSEHEGPVDSGSALSLKYHSARAFATHKHGCTRSNNIASMQLAFTEVVGLCTLFLVWNRPMSTYFIAILVAYNSTNASSSSVCLIKYLYMYIFLLFLH